MSSHIWDKTNGSLLFLHSSCIFLLHCMHSPYVMYITQNKHSYISRERRKAQAYILLSLQGPQVIGITFHTNLSKNSATWFTIFSTSQNYNKQFAEGRTPLDSDKSTYKKISIYCRNINHTPQIQVLEFYKENDLVYSMLLGTGT